jgi:hypothetical protein
MLDEWVLDLTFGTEPLPCFCPYDRENDSIVTGLNMLTNKCPGELIGVVHPEGQEAVEKWCEENPDWHVRYSKASNQ